MYTLHNFYLCLRGQYLSDIVDTTIESLQLGSAENQDQGLGPATLVEQCRCPKGYMGLSCEVNQPQITNVTNFFRTNLKKTKYTTNRTKTFL